MHQQHVNQPAMDEKKALYYIDGSHGKVGSQSQNAAAVVRVTCRGGKIRVHHMEVWNLVSEIEVRL